LSRFTTNSDVCIHIHMYTKRLQLLITPEHHVLLNALAKTEKTSVNFLVREAIDKAYGSQKSEDLFSRVERLRKNVKGQITVEDILEWRDAGRKDLA
jgi:hypothetical protein